MSQLNRRAQFLPIVALAGVTAAMLLIFLYAPTERLQGNIQRIFYIHVPSAWIMYLAFIVVAASSVLVLARRTDWERWDRMGSAAAELGVVFTTIVLTTGPIWGHRVWGVWWVWDARLTSTLVLWLIYVGYLVFRSLTPAGERRARLSAVIGVIGAVDIPVIHFAVIWWRTLHPLPTVLRPGGPQLPGSMLLTLMVSLVAFTILFVSLLVLRMQIAAARDRVDTIATLQPARV
jgi:heme exporter protein C